MKKYFEIIEPERFWSKVKKTKGCWNWVAGKDKNGYGKISIHRKDYRAHRLSYEMYWKKVIPKGLLVLHKCDNPSCVNPKHLSLGTNQDNMKDMVRKGRRSTFLSGETHPLSKLNNNLVRKIQRILKINNEYGINRKLAKMYNISESIISRIKHNKRWRHI